MHILWCRTSICSCKLSAKVSLMLDNPFPVPSLWKLNHIGVCFIQISTKIACKQLIPSRRESHVFFWSDPWCFGLLGKFQHNIFTTLSRVFYICGNLGNVKEKRTRKNCFSHEIKRLALRNYLAEFCLAPLLWCQWSFYCNFMRKKCSNGGVYVKRF